MTLRRICACSRSLAERVARRNPEELTLDFAKAGRERQISIDYKRNQ